MTNTPSWELIPLDLMIIIFTFLPRRDRLSCSMVCSRWKYAMSSPALWHHLVIFLDTDLMEPSTMILTREYHMFIKSIEFCWSKPQMPTRWLPHKIQEITKRACRYFIILTERFVQVSSVTLHSWYELSRLKKIVYHLSLFLKSQTNLSSVSFCNALLNKSDFIKLFVACGNSEEVVAHLDIRYCFCHFEMNLFSTQFSTFMERLVNLKELKVDYSTFRKEVKQVLLGGKHNHLNQLEIYIQNDDMTPTSEEDWLNLKSQLGALNVYLYFYNIANIEGVLAILQKSIPLKAFSLVTGKCWKNDNQNNCYDLFRILGKFYRTTLEILEIRFRDNVEVADEMLVCIVTQCKMLRSFQFSGIVNSMDTIRQICNQQVEQNSFKNIELAVRHMNLENHYSMVKLYEDMSRYKKATNVNFKVHNAKYKNILYVYY